MPAISATKVGYTVLLDWSHHDSRTVCWRGQKIEGDAAAGVIWTSKLN